MTELKKIPLAGVIGQPIAQSASPKLHGHWLKRYNLPGFYVPMEVQPQDLAEVLKTLPKMGFVGANVTIPHKEAVLKLADVVTDRAQNIGAANTLIFDAEGRITADNTDGLGFIENLRQNAKNWRPEAGPAIVLGAGGAARAIISALLDAGVPEIRLFNRTLSRANQLAEDFGPRVFVHLWSEIGLYLEECRTFVNTTSLGMTGKAALDVDISGLQSGCLVTDIVYNPLKTDLLAQAQSLGLPYVDGLGMLLHQAAPGFAQWFGKTPEVDAELRAAVLG